MAFIARYLQIEPGDPSGFWQKLMFTLLHGKFEKRICTWEHFGREFLIGESLFTIFASLA